MNIACGFMTLSYCTVALGTGQWQLLGVMFSALQSGIGEASCLGMCAKYGGRKAVAAWSSGTGLAGPCGYGVIWLLHLLVGFSLRTTLLFANISAGERAAVGYIEGTLQSHMSGAAHQICAERLQGLGCSRLRSC